MSFPSVSSQDCYIKPAIGSFPWAKHKHKATLSSVQLTITPSVTAILQRQTTSHVGIKLEFNGPIAGLSPNSVSDKFNQGPYMDIMTYSVKPKDHKSPCIFDSAGGTPVKRNQIIIQNNHGFSFGLNSTLGFQGGAQGNAAALLNYAYNVTRTQQVEKPEFENKEYLKGREKIVTFSMTTCYSGEKVAQYNIKRYNSLRKSEHPARIGIGLVPFFGWFGGWHVFPDKTYTPPDTAMSTISGNWSLEYEIDKDIDSIAFWWTIEVRTVFASNDKDVPDRKPCRERLNWIATIHQVTYLITIDFALPDIILDVAQKNTRMACANGYEGITKKIKFVNNGNTTVHSSKDVSKVQNYFNTKIKPQNY